MFPNTCEVTAIYHFVIVVVVIVDVVVVAAVNIQVAMYIILSICTVIVVVVTVMRPSYRLHKPTRRFAPCRLDLVYSRPRRASAVMLSHATPLLVEMSRDVSMR